ncbi:UDP-glucose:undecaprenyl-phosphate glucose-1-phosphate transferase [Candidatus Rubidus massiliensis]|nr:UDP-glucose:undecaprenyl-phosphate glucose-1-phosphate transferase [Candidatus Rubidus massiliensis]
MTQTSAIDESKQFIKVIENCPEKHLFFKRFFDIVFSSFALLFSFPILVLVGLLIFFTSRGKIVYSHERVGRGGKSFFCYKFRTMYADADVRLKKILTENPSYRLEWEKSRKLKNDPRITPIGKFLRKTSLDEFPQFWNVLKGDMSIVGPRPVVKDEVIHHINHNAPIILSFRPGITGLWQVSGRSDTSYEKRVELDLSYIKNYSLINDVKIILKTIPALIFSRGAY